METSFKWYSEIYFQKILLTFENIFSEDEKEKNFGLI